MTARLGYKDFPKSDSRRYFVALMAVDRLKDAATIHYVSLDIGCNRIEAQRALEAVSTQFGVVFVRQGPVYSVQSWGVLKKTAVARLLESGK
jgi:hypothetical protein